MFAALLSKISEKLDIYKLTFRIWLRAGGRRVCPHKVDDHFIPAPAQLHSVSVMRAEETEGSESRTK